MARGIGDAAIGCIWDPVAVAVAIELGEGVELPMRIGGKMGPMSGGSGRYQRAHRQDRHPTASQRFGEGTSQAGDAVALHAVRTFWHLNIVAISHRTQTFSPNVFTAVGIDPTRKQILIVKSMQHFYAGFAPIARPRIIYVAAPGVLVPDFSLLPYEKANRAIWPLGE